MNNKVIAGLSAVFAVLLIVATQPYWSEYVRLPALNQSASESAAYVPEKISQISFTKEGQDPITLMHTNEDWLVNEHPADLEQVNELLQDLSQLEFTSVVSTNADNFGQYDATESATMISLENALGEKSELLIGSAASQYGFIHLRPVGVDSVYLVRSQLRSFSNRGVSDWRDKTVIAVAEEDIAQITISQNGQEVLISPDDEGRWMALKGTDERVIGDVSKERLFETLADLQGTGFADEEKVLLYQQARNPLRVEITYSSEKEPEALVFVEDINNSNWLVNSVVMEDIITVSPATVSLIKDNSLTLFE